MKVELIRYTLKPEKAMAEAASACYRSVPKEFVVDHCIRSGHESISEFGDFHFKIEGISRACSHQLVRHRLASYAQESQRYVDMTNFNYVTPDKIKNNPMAQMQFKMLMEQIIKCYDELRKQGIPNEDARFVLPNACTSIIHVKMNFRELMHACGERECCCAQWEIRNVFKEMHRLVNKVSPFLGKYLGPKCIRLGYCPEGSRSCGLKPTREEVLSAYEWWVRQGKPKIN